MHTHAEKSQETKSPSVSNEAAQISDSSEATFQFIDQRPEGHTQEKFQKTQKKTAHSTKINTFQAIANNSVHHKHIAQLQTLANSYTAQQKLPIGAKENKTGLPNQLKSGIEHLSGYSMDDVKVHYNSDKPKQLNAHAYAQGSEIHLGSGQEKHLAHEAWHVVQQKQGRVKPTKQLKGKQAINDEAHLEKEADVMGEKSLKLMNTTPENQKTLQPKRKSLGKASATPQLSSVVQFTIFNMGDDPKKAKLHGNRLSKRTGDDIVEVPIPKLENKDEQMFLAENPITIMIHGSTLSKMGPDSFAELLRAKGFVRGAHSEIVLISCSGARILGKAGQALSNALNSIIHLAVGNVYVNKEGLPIVRVKVAEGLKDLKVDYSDDIKRQIPREAEGWTKFEPQIEELRKVAFRDLRYSRREAQQIINKAAEIKKTGYEVEKLEGILENAGYIIKNLGTMALRLEGSIKAVRRERDELDTLMDEDLEPLKKELAPIEAEYSHRKRLEAMHTVPEIDEDEIGEGWGDLDLDLDLDLEEDSEAPKASSTTEKGGTATVAEEDTTQFKTISSTPSTSNNQEVVQRMLITVYHSTPQARAENPRLEEDRQTLIKAEATLESKLGEKAQPAANISKLGKGEPLRILGHGESAAFEGYTAKEYAKILIAQGLPDNAELIEFYSCSLNAKPDGFAATLLGLLRPRFTKLNIMAASSILELSEKGDVGVYPTALVEEMETLDHGFDQKFDQLLKAGKAELKSAREFNEKGVLQLTTSIMAAQEKLNQLEADEWTSAKWDSDSEEEEQEEAAPDPVVERKKRSLEEEIARSKEILALHKENFIRQRAAILEEYDHLHKTAFAKYKRDENAINVRYLGTNTRGLEKVKLPPKVAGEIPERLGFFEQYGLEEDTK